MSRVIFVVAASSLLAACASVDTPLPAPVYYLAGPGGEAQVWRLDADAATTIQLTHEPSGVSDFAVSPADGTLAVVSNNRLYLTQGESGGRTLVADGNLVQEASEDLVVRNAVEAPSFSTDGRTLAYALNGLHLYDVATGEDEHVLVNGGHLLGEIYALSRENYAPGAWSPDGSRLVLHMGYADGSTLAVMEPGARQPFTRMRSDFLVEGGVTWSPDSRALYVANPNFSVVWPGLWRYDALSGEASSLVTTEPGSSQFVGWPVQLPSGELLFFHGEEFSPDVGIPLRMSRSDGDGSNLAPVRPETFHIADALWAPDGSLVLIAQTNGGGNMQLVLARPDKSPLQVLTEGAWIRGLVWGP